MAERVAASHGIIPNNNMMIKGMTKAAKRISVNQTHVDFFTVQF